MSTDTTTKQTKPRGKNSYFAIKKPIGGSKKRITAKSEKFAQEYARTLNATQSALKAYNTTDKGVACCIGSENISKPHIAERIQELINAQITDDELLGLHIRNARQTDNLATSQKAIESYEVLKGIAKKEDKQNDSITVNIENTKVIQMVTIFETELKKQLGYGNIS